MPHESSQPEHEAIEWGWSVQRFSVLSPTEVVALWNLDSGSDYNMCLYTETLPRQDLDRANTVYSAFADSPLPEARTWLSYLCVANLTLVDHDAGVTLWDQLIRDINPNVRDTVASQLDELMSNTGADSSDGDHRLAIRMRLLASSTLDEEYLRRESGLTRQDAYDLYLSYAYAENGQFLHDVGEAALAKLAAVQPPTE